MIKFIASFFYFFRYLFVTKKVDILFYYPQHFNRGKNGENLFFKPLYESCKSNNISYLIFEEPDRKSDKIRNKEVIPFDFIYFLIIILRKIGFTEQKIGKILSFTFLRGIKFKNYIVLSQSMLEIFRVVNKDAKLFDLQHGIIYSDKENYIKNDVVYSKLSEKNVELLVLGEEFKEILEKSDSSNYLKKNTHVIGTKKHKTFLHTHPNRFILVTLQITEDHTEEQNQKLLDEVINMVNVNEDLVFFIRNHPRFNNNLDLSELLKKTNVAPTSLMQCFKDCSIHVTAYSTTSFECAEFGIPTVFLKSLKDNFNMFENEFKYPFDASLEDIFLEYEKYSNEVISWRKRFYSHFDEKKFRSLLK